MKNIRILIRIIIFDILYSVLKGHIRTIINQLRLRAIQIEHETTAYPEEMELRKLIINDDYYKKLLPLVLCDSVKELYFYQNKKIMQNGVMTDVCEVCYFFVLCKCSVIRNLF